MSQNQKKPSRLNIEFRKKDKNPPVVINIRPNTPNPVSKNIFDPPKQSQPLPVSIAPASSGNISINTPSLNTQKSGNLTFTKGPSSTQIIISPPTQQTQPFSQQTSQPSSQPQINPQKNFERLSLLSFISSFEDEKSFNETDLEVLGLDLEYKKPILPMLHSVFSDAPLLDHSKHPMPECYSKIQSGNPAEKLSLFSSKTLLFIFYTYPHDPLQIQAAAELTKRQWSFDEENEVWNDQDGNPWSVDQWRELDVNQENELDNS